MAWAGNRSLHIGEQSSRWSLQQLSPDQLFLAFDTSGLPAGCSLQAVIDNGRGGRSAPFLLAHILRMPQIDSFTVSADPPQNGMRQYQLTGDEPGDDSEARVGRKRRSGCRRSSRAAPGPGIEAIDRHQPSGPAGRRRYALHLAAGGQARPRCHHQGSGSPAASACARRSSHGAATPHGRAPRFSSRAPISLSRRAAGRFPIQSAASFSRLIADTGTW